MQFEHVSVFIILYFVTCDNLRTALSSFYIFFLKKFILNITNDVNSLSVVSFNNITFAFCMYLIL